jgi:dTDP-4-dehydrorhamnose reductase
MRLLVTGGSGFVGWNLTRLARERGHDVTYTYHEHDVGRDGATAQEMDLRRPAQVREVVGESDPEAVVHAAATTDVDACERNPVRARRINVEGTRHVVDAAEAVDARTVLISTSFVFDGTAHEHREDDERNPVNRYGESKADTERVVESTACDPLVVRTDQPYGFAEPWQGGTMVDWTLERLDRGEPFRVFTDWYNDPIHVDDLNRVVLALLDGGHAGRYHAVGPDFVSRYEWALAIAAAFDRPTEPIERGTAADVGFPAERPNADLSNAKVRRRTGLSIDGIERGLARLASDGGAGDEDLLSRD